MAFPSFFALLSNQNLPVVRLQRNSKLKLLCTLSVKDPLTFYRIVLEQNKILIYASGHQEK